MSTEAEWKVLAKLFADERVAFRHQMGLFKCPASDFYASSDSLALIRAQKQAVLGSTDADQYMLESEAGRLAFEEFVLTLGLRADPPDSVWDNKTLNRAITLCLEPDWMLLSPADWRLAWASVCFPTRWSLVGKALQPLQSIHGAVPGLNEEMGRKIAAFFGRLPVGEGWGRANWGLSSNGELNQHPALPYAPLTMQTLLPEVFFRVEFQHLLKLPKTGAIAFGIRILNFPLQEVRQRPGFAAGLKERLRTMPDEVAVYKGIPTNFWQRI